MQQLEQTVAQLRGTRGDGIDLVGIEESSDICPVQNFHFDCGLLVSHYKFCPKFPVQLRGPSRVLKLRVREVIHIQEKLTCGLPKVFELADLVVLH